jgi:hypothetical protein
MMAEAVVDMKEMANRVTITATLKNARQFHWRVWLGVRLIKLAAWVMWMDVEFEGEDDERDMSDFVTWR